MGKFYVTTAIDYTNDIIHVGHSYQKMLADVLARYHRLKGDQTHFLTGTDEHGQKVERSAKDKGIEPKKFVDRIALEDKKQWDNLNISYDRFIRTTDPDHVKFAQEFYLKSKAAGNIYPSKYEGFYCEGCEAYLEANELVNGRCPYHPTKTPVKIEEENYFFRLSKYQKFLEEYIESHPDFIVPENRKNEVLSFIRSGLKDFSVTRKNVKWGIPVPDDQEHTIYVWFDALINYLTYGIEKDCWPADIHILGKDNLRFHAVYWPAMLKSAGYKLPKTILVHEFITLNGQKISKSLGNVILPSDLVKKFGVDGVRYFFLRHGPLINDVDISLEKIEEVYNADLANGLGNLVSRVAAMAAKNELRVHKSEIKSFSKKVSENIESYHLNVTLTHVWEEIKKIDTLISEERVWELPSDKKQTALIKIVQSIRQIAYDLAPFLPETAQKIQKIFTGKIKSTEPLFPRR